MSAFIMASAAGLILLIAAAAALAYAASAGTAIYGAWNPSTFQQPLSSL